ncbi:unnamed protein product [Withania somnifera]
MLRILGKNLKISKSSIMVARSEVEIEDLSVWEFVNPSDDEQEDVQTIGALVVCNVGYDYHNDDQEEEDEEEEDEDEDFDFDDGLVPNWLSDKFGRQRIRKLGKRAGSRMNKSKRGPCIFNRPGCVRGKHGFGVQHSYV